MASISIFRFTLTSVYIELKTFSDHGSRITLNHKAIISLQIWAYQTKANPSSEVVSLSCTVPQVVSIEIRFIALPSFYPLGNIPLFKWQIPIDPFLRIKDIKISRICLVDVNRSIICLFSNDMVHQHFGFII